MATSCLIEALNKKPTCGIPTPEHEELPVIADMNNRDIPFLDSGQHYIERHLSRDTIDTNGWVAIL
ncbi:hypothetical protein [Desulfogranum japonicum]|uniref:hypothetical protein n=1 Tax=Desulfogranum japonicum TaxID=231447 RepID=UPI00040EF888|nr:hypothetical protein [Desulfogranum japonicum]